MPIIAAKASIIGAGPETPGGSSDSVERENRWSS